MSRNLLRLFAVVFLSVSSIYAASYPDMNREKWENDYLDFNPEIHSYEKYAKERNRIFDRAVGGGAKKITCSFYPDGNKQISYLNPGKEMTISFVDAIGNIHERAVVVGDALADDFGCMGACGPSCPTRGLPNAFTMDCLKHDICVLEFGIDPKNKRSDHPMCGNLFDNAVDDWCSNGHIFQDSK